MRRPSPWLPGSSRARSRASRSRRGPAAARAPRRRERRRASWHATPSPVDSEPMPDRVVRDFPLFPLGKVALPHELVPLHIFEDRYRTMIGECLERGSEFGIVWAGDDDVRAVGCAMEITEVLERTEDGRMNILTRGTRPFRIVDEQHDLPYPAGTVE